MKRIQELGHHTSEAITDQEDSSAPAASGKANINILTDHVAPVIQKKIWIDIDNSPHVPFFIPIIESLRKRGHKVLLTARDSYQVCELLEFHHLDCKVVGTHWGKNRFLKTLGTLGRAARLLPWAFREKPDLAVSLVSRAQLLACRVLGIPMAVTFDYEFVVKLQFLQPDWILVPDVMPEAGAGVAKKGVFRFPGLKEDVYVPGFQPDSCLRKQMGVAESDLLVTVRPPATEAHYHNPESDRLMEAALKFLTKQNGARVALLPRNQRQSSQLQKHWAADIATGKIVIPAHVMNGLNLIWNSDFVISGGGTMNREAAALGVPVYSIFRGKIGAVDRFLAGSGRLMLLERVEDIDSKILLRHRERIRREPSTDSPTLRSISEAIISIAEHQCLPPRP
jgi:hypothetical protein